jgi:hypothetical protein
MDGKRVFVAICVLCLLGWAAPNRSDGGFLRMANDAGGQGAYVNLIVREVKVTPIRAHAGDPVRIEMTIEHQGEGYGTIPAEVRANGKVVADSLFTYGFNDEPGQLYRESFLWDTKGVPPGEYRIRGEVFLWTDASEFDNYLDVQEPLVLLPPGQALPEGIGNGGAGVVVDPRWSPPKRTGSSATPVDSVGY